MNYKITFVRMFTDIFPDNKIMLQYCLQGLWDLPYCLQGPCVQVSEKIVFTAFYFLPNISTTCYVKSRLSSSGVFCTLVFSFKVTCGCWTAAFDHGENNQ